MIISMQYPPKLVDAPVIYQLSRQFNVKFSILRAVVEAEFAQLTLEITGKPEDLQQGLEYLRGQGITVSLNSNILIDMDTCVSCGACTGVCPSRALKINGDAHLAFEEARCINCQLCISACPLRAITPSVIPPAGGIQASP